MRSSHDGDVNPSLSFDEEFCIMDMGCGHVMRQLTCSPEDVAALDDLLSQVSFDASREEWLALLSSSSSSATVWLGATGVFNAADDLIGLTSTVVYADGRFGWCGNIVVRADYRKRGVASMVLRAALDAIRREDNNDNENGGGGSGGGVTALLDASEMGLPLYLKAGFIPVSRVGRYFLSKENAVARFRAKSRRASGDVEDIGGGAEENESSGRSVEERGRLETMTTMTTTTTTTTTTEEGGETEAAVAARLEAIDWDGEDGAAVRAMDADVFGADRGELLSAWRGGAQVLNSFDP